jgi:peroxiredoxin/mono/diheme cytochrome c family protein
MRRTRISALLVCLALVALCRLQADEQAPNDKLGKKIDNVTLADAGGTSFRLHDLKDKKAVVVVFLSFDCPVSNRYAETLAALAKNHADRGVAFVGINSSDDLDATAVARQAKEYRLPFAVYKDKDCAAADAFKADVAPQAFVLDHNFVLRYRGRIDNSYSARLKKNSQTTRHDLQAALEEILAGKPVSEPITKAIGCPIQRDKEPKKTGAVTWYRDVLPIVQNNCQSCHRPGEVGPFALQNYKQAVNWAGDIKDYTQSRKMPPWKIEEGVAFHNQRKLTDKEIATLAAWADGGTPEGDPKDAPQAKTFIDGWQLGKPDLVLTVPEEMTVGASGRDLFRCYVLPTNLDQDKYVAAIEVRPGNPRVLHHTLHFLDSTGKGRELEKKARDNARPDDKDHGPGYSMAMGIGFAPQGGLSGWAPGQVARYLPEGTGFLLPKGSDVVVQAHYHRTGRIEKDRTSIGLHFAKKPVEKRYQGMVIQGRFLLIPSGVERFKVEGAIEVQQDCTLHSVMPHMHMLGKEIKVTLKPKEGNTATLLHIKDWDYNWQETYWLQKPIELKAGTRLEVEAFYDNSAKNPQNPFHPPQMVFLGEQTDNEMCFVFLGATSEKPGRIQFAPLDKDGNPTRRIPLVRPPSEPAKDK